MQSLSKSLLVLAGLNNFCLINQPESFYTTYILNRIDFSAVIVDHDPPLAKTW